MQIQVSNVKGYSIPSIAQHVFSALLCKHPTNPVLPTFGIGGTFAKKKQSQMRYDKEQIDQWLTEWEQSGQSISKYCDGKPFDKSTFYNWRSKERKPSVINEHKSKFVSVQVSPSFIPQMSIHYPNGVRVDMHMMLSIDSIRALAGC